MYQIEDKPEWGDLATFVPNKSMPVYSWFYFKEGFSRDLVLKIINGFNFKPPVLDPFCGVGTTLLACKELGFDCHGFDVSPLCVFSSKVKTADYDPIRLKQAENDLKKVRFQKPETGWVPRHIRRFFNPHILEDVVFFKNLVFSLDEDIRDFFLLALINSSTRASYMYKDGSVLKIRKKPTPPFRKFFMRQVDRMIKDLRKTNFRPCKILAEEGDARRLNLPDNSISGVITSPPYLNKIEYTNIYRVEEFLFFNRPEKTGIRSYIGLDTDVEPVFDQNLPPVADAYFSDMKRVLSELYRVCKEKAKVAVVVGNGCFPDRVVESDLLISKLAEDQGFEVKKIYALNKRWCTAERVRKVGIMRESLLVFEKK